MTRKQQIAIVGCGAAAVSLLRSLVELSSKKHSTLAITLFDAAESFGVGLAYQHDLNNLMINRPIQTMSAHAVNLHEFHEWFEKKHAHATDKKNTFQNGDDQPAYLSRKTFGLYLQDILQATIADAKAKGIDVSLVKKEIVTINTMNPYALVAADGEVFMADHLLLCTGNNLPQDVYDLNTTPHYINNPYPISTKLKTLNPFQRVGIVGNSLTAIDIAISLKALGHYGPIVMLARTKVFPRVRGKIVRYPLQFFQQAAMESIYQRQGYLTLRDALRLLRKELLAVQHDWRLLFKANAAGDDFLTSMRLERTAAGQERKWQSVLSATNHVIECCWHYLNHASKVMFINKFNRLWLNNRSPIPRENADLLIQMTESGQLSQQSALKSLIYRAGTYQASFHGDANLTFDCIINATGPAKQIGSGDRLLHSLLTQGWLRKNNFAGVEVDFESSAAIDLAGQCNKTLRLIGHNTTGVHYYTSSLEMIAKRSRSVAASLLHLLQAEETIITEHLVADSIDAKKSHQQSDTSEFQVDSLHYALSSSSRRSKRDGHGIATAANKKRVCC